jgi:hypothetical protein
MTENYASISKRLKELRGEKNRSDPGCLCRGGGWIAVWPHRSRLECIECPVCKNPEHKVKPI